MVLDVSKGAHFLEFVSSIVNLVNKLYSLGYKVQQILFVLAIKTLISE